jgi:hypothetical protein
MSCSIPGQFHTTLQENIPTECNEEINWISLLRISVENIHTNGAIKVTHSNQSAGTAQTGCCINCAGHSESDKKSTLCAVN